MALKGVRDSEKIWNFLVDHGLNEYGAAGLIGNLDAESALRSNNLQDTYSIKLLMNDETYTARVDNGQYTNFVNDEAGYGLAQWTWWTRKQNLLNFAKQSGKSIGDLEMQLNFLLKELKENYTRSVYAMLLSATSVQEASDAVLMHFEQPYNAASKKTTRADMGLKYYNMYASKTVNTTTNKEDKNSMVKTYNESDRVQLSKNFNSYEFRCGLGSPCACTTILIDDKLVEYLQKIRDHFNTPITITSAYRCESYNKRIGGAVGSRHSKGQAADISVKGVTPREVAKYAESIGIKGIGLYETNADGYFVHIDTRETKSFWYGQSESPRTTFGGTSSSGTSTSTSTSTSKPLGQAYSVTFNMLAQGMSGNQVKALQQLLEANGYEVGTPDGQFGASTATALKKYQAAKNLQADGVAGPLVIKSLMGY